MTIFLSSLLWTKWVIGDIDLVTTHTTDTAYNIPGVVGNDVELPGVDTAKVTEYDSQPSINEHKSSAKDTAKVMEYDSQQDTTNKPQDSTDEVGFEASSHDNAKQQDEDTTASQPDLTHSHDGHHEIINKYQNTFPV